MESKGKSAGKRIVFTGGSGKAGRHCIPYLIAQGHQVLNLDLIPLGHPDVYDLKTDLTDAGQVYNALTSHFSPEEYANAQGPQVPDVVIHFAAYARNLLVPDNKCFVANVTSTYNVIEAACKLGVRKIVIASSETTYSICFAQGDIIFKSFPLEEDKPELNDPEDSYACSKLCGEQVARTFARRFRADIYCLRIGNVIEPHEYARDFPAYLANPKLRERNVWSYIDARDLGQICHLCIEKDGLGYQVFNATNDTITTRLPTNQFLEKEYPDVPITRDLSEWEAPLSNKKIRDVLGFREEHNWRKYVSI